MKRLKQKLNSRRGASILLAMLLMLVAVMISAVVVSAAVSAADRVDRDTSQEQEILALDSAAKAMVDYLERGGSYEYKDEVSTKPALLADPGQTVIHPAPVVEYIATKLDGSTSAVTFNLTEEMVPPDDLPDAALDGARMKLTVQHDYDESTDSSYSAYYSVTGTVFIGDDPDKSPRKLYVDGIISKTEEESNRNVPVIVYVENPTYDPSDPDSPEKLEDTENVRIDITTTIWSVSSMKLTTNQTT